MCQFYMVDNPTYPSYYVVRIIYVIRLWKKELPVYLKKALMPCVTMPVYINSLKMN